MSNEVENNEDIIEEAAPESEVEESATEDASLASEGDGEQSEKPKKKSKARVVIMTLVIVVVLLFGGGGVVYATQHSNPQFCNLICHVPMDPYVASYMDGTSINPQQANLTYPLEVTKHKDTDQDVVCVSCHTDGIDSQIQEGLSWVTGNYTLPLELTMTVKEPNAPHQRSGIETCLTAGCHEGINTLVDLKEATSHLTRNPHQSHNGDQNCTTCHQQHEQSVMTCTQCHPGDAVVPDGWLTYDEKQKQIKEAS